MSEEEEKALKVINARTRRLLDELEIEKEDMLDEPKIAYLMQEIRANKTVLNLIDQLQSQLNEKDNSIKLILKRLGKSEDLIEHVADRKGHDYRYAIDPTKIKTELGWEPETKFEDGIVKTIDWYLANPDWLK